MRWDQYYQATDNGKVKPATIPLKDNLPVLRNIQTLMRQSPYQHVVNGLGDYTPDQNGDCLSKSVWAVNKLVSWGLPRGALNLSYVKTEDNQPHMIINVNTDQGPYAIDERAADVVPVSGLPYKTISTQQPGQPIWR